MTARLLLFLTESLIPKKVKRLPFVAPDFLKQLYLDLLNLK